MSTWRHNPSSQQCTTGCAAEACLTLYMTSAGEVGVVMAVAPACNPDTPILVNVSSDTDVVLLQPEPAFSSTQVPTWPSLYAPHHAAERLMAVSSLVSA